MKRSPIWCAAFADAWKRMRYGARFVDVPIEGGGVRVERTPWTLDEVGRAAAYEATACEAAFFAAFPEERTAPAGAEEEIEHG